MSWQRPNTGEKVRGLHDEEIRIDRIHTVEAQPHVPRAAEGIVQASEVFYRT